MPTYKVRGETALLECDFEMNNNNNKHIFGNNGNSNYDSNEQNDGTESLYSVKWYKDNEEFFRYVPRMSPSIQSYKVDGVRVDVSISLSILFIQN